MKFQAINDFVIVRMEVKVEGNIIIPDITKVVSSMNTKIDFFAHSVGPEVKHLKEGQKLLLPRYITDNPNYILDQLRENTGKSSISSTVYFLVREADVAAYITEEDKPETNVNVNTGEKTKTKIKK